MKYKEANTVVGVIIFWVVDVLSVIGEGWEAWWPEFKPLMIQFVVNVVGLGIIGLVAIGDYIRRVWPAIVAAAKQLISLDIPMAKIVTVLKKPIIFEQYGGEW